MLTIEGLKAYGADTDDGLKRCMNNEMFYLRLVGMIFKDDKIGELGQALDEKNYDHAFEIVHALKGMYANLSLTPILNPVLQMTELLRNREDTDYSALYNELKTQYENLKQLL